MLTHHGLSRVIAPVFQPIVDLVSGGTLYFEALARSSTNRSHTELLRCAESFGFIELVDAAMFDLATRLLAMDPDLSIAVNASVGTIERNCGPFVAAIFGHLQEADRLVVEITETMAVSEPRSLEVFMAGARAAGVRIAFDDFGDGHFSFDHIVRFKPDIVKLAGVMLARPDERHRDIARLLSMAAVQGFDVVAENIDSDEKRQSCIDMGIRYGQGFLLGELAETPVRTTGMAVSDARRGMRSAAKS
ncbi:EAL domain-containing protein (putative c-di-GMP-specific phosphodiesterase class I) [Xanthomonas sacchari]|uniref:EAL domain-containing protein n=1 Tax=Xanthomonas sacchari TaxID=56458 RepID=UPI00278A8ACF|nr:EAL domain-containing protein [Xanthomonas sacchari]MDQ1090691.1 EAL domain-containing protein (putative c-di-GMP-specific phosphodiesterase class I) [Xanthomonas sacchari]